jgi:hypothetical protein
MMSETGQDPYDLTKRRHGMDDVPADQVVAYQPPPFRGKLVSSRVMKKRCA